MSSSDLMCCTNCGDKLEKYADTPRFCGGCFPSKRLPMEEVRKVFDVEPTIQQNRIAREKRDMARFGRIGEETSNTDYNFGNDISSRGELDQNRL